MEKLHLLCNAHLDPAWLWRWNEGAAEAVSTFRVAADFCEQYDGFVFNHNEALLYEWVEEYEPELFKRIQHLVKEGKWKIMGGWYLQPDRVMISGESFLNQIDLGQEYFKEKFGVLPTTAINFDSFGHSGGLVQILKNRGYDSYIFMRPNDMFLGDFFWEGVDGSRVLAHGIYGGYASYERQALSKLKSYIEYETRDTGLCLWGIGNHGGGPSRVDYKDISDYMNKTKIDIVHSFAENYMAEIDRSNLKVWTGSLVPSNVGCYTTMVRIKQANRRLENKLAETDKILCCAEIMSDFQWDHKELQKARRALAFCQFHDILPGTGIRHVEEDSLKTLGYGEEIADKLYMKAFFKLCEGQKPAKDGEIPIMVFNPHPYEIEGEFEADFLLENQNWNEDEETLAKVYDTNGKELPTQNEKANCTFNLDWTKKISFRGKIAPYSISRFDCRLTTVKKDLLPEKSCNDDIICIENDRMKVRISKKTGLLDLYEVDGKRFIENSGKLVVFKDNEDPWGMTVDSFKEYEGEFVLMSDEAANAFSGYPKETGANVRIVEDGDVRIKIQSFFEYQRSVAVVEYTIPKKGIYVDVCVLLYSNEPNKMIKYRIDTQLHGIPYGEIAFGEEKMFLEEKESVFHKWCGIREENQGLYVVNKGIYGGSFTEKTIYLSLLRTPIYAAHAIEGRQIAPHDRFIKHIDMGEREFPFRITAEKNIAREAQVYNEAPGILSFFPSGQGKTKGEFMKIDNPDVILTSFKKQGNGYKMNLHNFSNQETDAEVYLMPKKEHISLHFGKYELKTIEVKF